MKRILIVGGTSAIATACARIWAREGAHFFIVGRNSQKLSTVKDDLQARGAQAVHLYVLDLKNIQEHRAMLDACQQALGQIDIALVAHGTLPSQEACEKDVALAVEEFTTNGLSVIALLTELANLMESQGSGTIAVISSVAGDRGRPSNYLYGAAKAAVSTFCEGLHARLFKKGVSVLTIKPGFVDTPMTQHLELPRLLVAQPEAVARDILRGIDRKTNTLYTPRFWWMIMKIIRLIPECLFKRMKL